MSRRQVGIVALCLTAALALGVGGAYGTVLTAGRSLVQQATSAFPIAPAGVGVAVSTSSDPAASSTTSSLTALALARTLAIKGRAPKTGYTRSQFGTGWKDPDRNGCDARNDALRRYLNHVVMRGTSQCVVYSGTLVDPYSGAVIHFVRGTRGIDIDHMVALSNAWQTGAQKLTYTSRVALANDPLNLQPTSTRLNEQKGDGDAATWLPPLKSYRCNYVARQVAVKAKYHLWVTSAERAAIVRILSTCPTLRAPTR